MAGLGGVIDVDQDTYVSTEKTSDDDTLFFYTAGAERAKIDNAGNVHVANNLTVSGNLAVSGDFTLGDATTDKITTKGDLYVEDDAVFSDTIRVTGDAYFAGDVGIGTATPSVSLDIVGTDAVKLPAGTDAQRPSAAEGLIRLNTDSDRFEGYNDGNWHALGQGTGNLTSDVYAANGVASGFALSATPNTDKDVLVSVGGVVQTPTTNYVVNSSTLNFTSIPPSGVEIEARHLNVGFIHYDDQTIPGDKTFPDDITILGNLSVSGDFTLGDATTDKITTRGDLHVEDDAFFTDKVGIGTTAPDVSLKLKYGGDDPAGTNPRVGAFSIEGGHTTLDMGVNNGSPFNSWIQTRHKDLSTYPTAYYPLVINPLGGSVGIGTNAPNARLDIHSDGSIAQGAEIRLQHDNNNTTDIVSTVNFANNAGSVAMIQAGTTGANNSGYISLFTDNAGTSAERMRIISDGKVGIGTSAPAQILHVAGGNLSTIRNNMFGVTSNSPGTGGETNIYHNAYYDTVNSREEYLVADEACGIEFINGQINFRTAAAGSADGAITWINAMGILADGKVGIGTTARGR